MAKLVDLAEVLKTRGATTGKTLHELLVDSTELCQIMRQLIINMNAHGGDPFTQLGVTRETFGKICLAVCRTLDQWAVAHTIALQKLREDTSVIAEELPEDIAHLGKGGISWN